MNKQTTREQAIEHRRRPVRNRLPTPIGGGRAAGACLTAGLMLGGCYEGYDGAVQEYDERVIGGFPVSSPSFDAVGALGTPTPGGVGTHHPFCTATLIGPDVLLTAEHCVWDLRDDTEFLIGFDGTNPDRTVPVAGAVTSPNQGDRFGIAGDVAIVFLEEPIPDIAPLAVGTGGPENIGIELGIMGYGDRSNERESGQRHAGLVTLAGIGGNHAINIWGSAEEYVQRFPELGIDADALDFLDSFLIGDHDVSLRRHEGGAQGCFGDSGGPLLGDGPHGLTVYAVTSRVWNTQDDICAWGTISAGFGPEAFKLYDTAAECKELSSAGICDGDTLRRCAMPSGSPAEIEEIDCTERDRVCDDSNGVPACIRED